MNLYCTSTMTTGNSTKTIQHYYFFNYELHQFMKQLHCHTVCFQTIQIYSHIFPLLVLSILEVLRLLYTFNVKHSIRKKNPFMVLRPWNHPTKPKLCSTVHHPFKYIRLAIHIYIFFLCVQCLHMESDSILETKQKGLFEQ